MLSIKPTYEENASPSLKSLGLDVKNIIGAISLKTDLPTEEDVHQTTNSSLSDFKKNYNEFVWLRKELNQRILAAKKEKIVLAEHIKDLICELEEICKCLPENSDHGSFTAPSSCEALIQWLDHKDNFESKMKVEFKIIMINI